MRNRTVWLLATGLVVAAPPASRAQDLLRVSFSSGTPPTAEFPDSDHEFGPKRIALFLDPSSFLNASSIWPGVPGVEPAPRSPVARAIAPPSTPPVLDGSVEARIPNAGANLPQPETRPSGLLALYAGFATLQFLDAHSTLQAVQSGYQESNPLVAPFTQSPAAMYAFKAATTTATILLVDKLSRNHRGAAIGLMIAANVAYASVVAYNYRQSSR